MEGDTLLRIKEAIEEYDARQEYHDKRIVRADKAVQCTGNSFIEFNSVDDGYFTLEHCEDDRARQLESDSDSLKYIIYVMQDTKRSNLEKLRDIGWELGFDFEDYQKKE